MSDSSAPQDVRTLVTRLTGRGTSALATLGILGPDAAAIATSLFHPIRGAIDLEKDHGPHYGLFGHQIHDDVVLARLTDSMRPRIEIHCHGGDATVEALLLQIVEAGATRVSVEEWLQHAGYSEIQVEAFQALARCPTSRCTAILLDQLQGSLERAFAAVAEQPSGNTARELLKWWKLGKHLVEPWRLLLVGRPNVGKSSLLNAILGYSRAIVSDRPGTTRDLLEGETAVDGWPVVFLDGAGARDAQDAIEAEGIERLRRSARDADLRILVADLSAPPCDEDERIAESMSVDLWIGNKSDLPTVWNEADRNRLTTIVSARERMGIDDLLKIIAARLVPDVPQAGQAVPFTRRQVEWLERFSND